MHDASINHDIKVIQELLKNNANIQDNYGRTPLYEASFFGYFDNVKLLIEYTNIELKDKDGATALDVACTDEIKDYIRNYQELPDIKEVSD